MAMRGCSEISLRILVWLRFCPTRRRGRRWLAAEIVPDVVSWGRMRGLGLVRGVRRGGCRRFCRVRDGKLRLRGRRARNSRVCGTLGRGFGDGSR